MGYNGKMARELLREELWKRIKPLLPAHPARPMGGSGQVDDRKALTGVVLVLKTRIPWENLPQEMGGGVAPVGDGCSI